SCSPKASRISLRSKCASPTARRKCCRKSGCTESERKFHLEAKRASRMRFRSSLSHTAVRGQSRARRVQTANCWRADVFANRPDSTSSPHFGIESLAENAEIAEAGQKGWHEIVLDSSRRGTWCCARHLFGSSPRSPRSPREIFR